MRVTEKKLKANRQNTNKSAGPKTERGKQIVNQNAAKKIRAMKNRGALKK